MNELIDIHYHWDLLSVSADDAVEDRAAEAVKAIDLYGLSGAIFSPQNSPIDRRRCSRHNRYARQLPKMTNGRCRAFACLPMPDVAATVQEIYQSAELCASPGVFLYTVYEGRMLSDKLFLPVWKALDEIGAIVFLHPCGLERNSYSTFPYQPPLCDFPHDTARAVIAMFLSS